MSTRRGANRGQLAWRIALRSSDLKATSKHVALTLDTYMDATGLAWPSRATLAKATGRSIKQVDRALHELECSGFLVVERSSGRNANRYHATLPNGDATDTVEGEERRHDDHRSTVLTATQRTVQRRQDERPTGTPRPREAVKKPSKTLKPETAGERPQGWIENPGRYTGCRLVRGSHAFTHVFDPLGTDRPPNDWPHERPTIAAIRAAIERNDAADEAAGGTQ
jgi:hypothetical protein